MSFPNRLKNIHHHPLLESPGDSACQTPEEGSPISQSLVSVLPDFDVSDLYEPPSNAINLLEVPNTNWNKSPGSSLNSSTADLSTTNIIYPDGGSYADRVSNSSCCNYHCLIFS